ncbi:hypothetical protein Poli38472_005089 [Pythium oligandrum]|uniref:Uncharacterized protein n=1 Tax=Pythium oligandrum TaxID=41045 RepID=A0A8K1CGN9_PYTOL|nr:hypothetical protein Poli38472_005089 [Pythium oligandrum]|eukprot:TMW62471.1 hypothetical protein Poli38472_005089 [Pythium oligandrum]
MSADETWQTRARRGIASAATRERLTAYTLLVQECSQSKASQQAVGAFLRDRIDVSMQRPPVPSITRDKTFKRIGDLIFADLQAVDRALRVAAARLICQVAYEHLVNQHALMQHATNGFSVGWVYVFSVPPVFVSQYHAECATHDRNPTTQGLTKYLQQMVSSNYEAAYKNVSRYYAGGCTTFLPLCWSCTLAKNEPDETKEMTVPDPAEYLLGYYLVPRQTQFPEQDESYADELLRSMDEDDVRCIQTVKEVFDEVSEVQEDGTVIVKAQVFERCCRKETSDADLTWIVNDTINIIAPMSEYFTDSSTNGSLSWSEILIFATMHRNLLHFGSLHGTDILDDLAKLFCKLQVDFSAKPIVSSTYVWEPALVSVIQSQSKMPDAFKRQAASLVRGKSVSDALLSTPWRGLLQFRLEELAPVSWAVFLARWRSAVALERLLCEQAALASQRDTTICSVNNLRKSIVQSQPRSYRDLDELRRDLPGIYRSQDRVDVRNRSLPVFDEVDERDEDEDGDDDDENEAVDEPSLSYNLALFHRLQRSVAEIDALSQQQAEARRRMKERQWESVANNRKRAEEDEERRRVALNTKYEEKEQRLAELEQHRARLRAAQHERQVRRLERISQRQRQEQLALEERQQAIMERLEQRDQAQERVQAMKQRRPMTSRVESTPAAQTPTPPLSRRPQSARTKTSVDDGEVVVTSPPSPETLRQRALLYGQVVSRVYRAEAARRPAPPSVLTYHQPHHLTRSFSTFGAGSINAKAPRSKPVPPPSAFSTAGSSLSRRPTRRPLVTTTDSASVVRSSSTAALTSPPANACSTLVMRNAVLAVSERISIPDVPAPVVEEAHVPPFVIAAQYAALNEDYKRKFRERFNLQNVSHRLSFHVLKQYTKLVRRDLAWQTFHEMAASTRMSSHPGNASQKIHDNQRIRHNEFAGVAQKLGISLTDKALQRIARQLDVKKTGTIEWKVFYAWWSMQYDEACASSASVKNKQEDVK